MVAPLSQVRVAGRTQLPVDVSSTPASWAGGFLFNFAQQGFLFQSMLIFLVYRKPRAKDQVSQDAERSHHSCKQGGENLDQFVLRAGANIAVGPENQGQPQGSQEGSKQCREILEEGRQAAQGRFGNRRDYTVGRDFRR